MQQRIEDRDIWSGLLEDKDDLSLREMGEKYNVAPSAIVAAFKRQGIRRRPAPSGPREARRRNRAAADAMAGEAAPGEQPARPEPRAGSKDRKLLRYWELIGKVPDTEIARRARVSPRTVGKFREHHGIPAAVGSPEAEAQAQAAPAAGEARPKRETPSVRRGRELERMLEPYAHLLGRLPDSVVGRLAGLSLQAVRHQRQKRGIAAAGKLPQREIDRLLAQEGLAAEAPLLAADSGAAPYAAEPSASAAAPAPAPAPAPRAVERRQLTNGGLQAWRFVFQRGEELQSRVVVANSFVDAARLAESYIGSTGAVSTVESLGYAIA